MRNSTRKELTNALKMKQKEIDDLRDELRVYRTNPDHRAAKDSVTEVGKAIDAILTSICRRYGDAVQGEAGSTYTIRFATPMVGEARPTVRKDDGWYEVSVILER